MNLKIHSDAETKIQRHIKGKLAYTIEFFPIELGEEEECVYERKTTMVVSVVLLELCP